MTIAPNLQASGSTAAKLAVRADVFKRLLPELRARAICISQVEDLDVVQRVRDLIAALPEGEDWNQAKRRITADISPYFVDAEDGEAQAAQQAAARARAELLLRTHTFQAYATARFRTQMDPRAASGYLRYETQGDGKVRPEHAALDGVILPKSDPFWQTHYPPWDWGCRCIAIEMEDAEVAQIRAQESDLPADRRTVLSDSQRAALSGSGRIARDGRSFFVGLPSGEKAYSWQPGQAQMPLDAVMDRYDDDTARAFAASMRQARVAGNDGAGSTVWDLMLAELRGRDPAAADAVLARVG